MGMLLAHNQKNTTSEKGQRRHNPSAPLTRKKEPGGWGVQGVPPPDLPLPGQASQSRHPLMAMFIPGEFHSHVSTTRPSFHPREAAATPTMGTPTQSSPSPTLPGVPR